MKYHSIKKARKHELKFLADIILVEGLYRDIRGIEKQAGMLDELGLSSILSHVVNEIKRNIDVQNPGMSLLKFLVPGILFRLNPVLGGLSILASQVGFDIETVFNAIKSGIQPKLESGQKISPEELNQIGIQAVRSEAGPLISEANDELFYLRKMSEKERKALISLAQARPNIPFLPSGHSTGSRLFGNLFSAMRYKGGISKIKWLLGGLIVWTFKVALLGAGLLGIGGIASGLLGLSKDKPEDKKPTDKEISPISPTEQVKYSPDIEVVELDSTGRGEQYFENSENRVWMVPLINGNVVETLLAWVEDIYPQLIEYEGLIVKSPSFTAVVNLFNKNKKSYEEIMVPSEFHSRKQVVDSFVKDVVSKIG